MAGPVGGPQAPDGSDAAAAWRAQRSDAAAEQAAALARRRAAESARAQASIGEFLVAAAQGGPAPEPLRARGYTGSATYRTDLVGWYLRANRTVAIDTEGRFYVLSVQGGLSARLRGATPAPTPPPVVLGAGGRDGESIDIADALRMVLDRA